MTDRPAVLVTGASKGIGAAVAIAFAREGYDIAVNYHRDADGAERTVQACEAFGTRAFAVRADVADRDAVTSMFVLCDERLGPLRCLVNNAGVIGGASTLEALRPNALHAVFATNVFGTVHCMQEAITRMSIKRSGPGGAIVNMSSLAATLGSPGEYVHYAATKGAVETLTIGAGKELGPHGIRVNAIRVGTTDTELHVREGSPDRPAAVAAATPLGRIARPDDIAAAVLWLASNGANFVTGTVLTVAGGLSP